LLSKPYEAYESRRAANIGLGNGDGTVTAYTILMRYDFVAGALNDTGALFVNPTTADGSGDTAYVAATITGTDATTISSVSLRQGGSTTAPGGVVIDNIVVSSIPEPSAALLGGLGLLALLRRRR
jgi:MYXO-CTERM domain-containing protein